MRHPETPAFDRIEYPIFMAGAGSEIRNANIIFPGRVDRSPCGTGTAARLALMHERGELGVGEEVASRSVIGGCFRSRIAGTTKVGNRSAVKPKISGRSWIYGRYTLGVHPSDPFPLGYTLSDTWGPGKPRD